MKITPYLSFDGCCAEAFGFYADLLGGKIGIMMTFKDAPEPMCADVPGWADKVMHAELTIGDHVLMGSDPPPAWRRDMQGISISLQIDDVAEAERAFGSLAEGGTVTMPLEETFWAKRFGMVTDRFGTPWMINCDKPMG